MKNRKKNSNVPNKAKFKPGSKKRENKCVVTFDDKERAEYLTGFHKRKVERRKVAIAEIRKKIKDEQNRVRQERHKEYIKMLKERQEALEESEDDLEDVITNTTESVQFDHPNHTVTVTTISDLDLTNNHLLERVTNKVNGEPKENDHGEQEEKLMTMPKKAGNPILNKKIRSLTSSLNAFTCKKRKRKQGGRGGRGQQTDKTDKRVTESKISAKKTSKWQRRRMTGKKHGQRD
ncbi:nucleolar protein 12 [Syngnathus typhle]|uniref:nucleolar protein 12 n=1 Tax=Syngnathus typhle TaxID=161592 RepID=UPI002A6B7195|nr:nucleolar protein 12 [Syngnathus typhle]